MKSTYGSLRHASKFRQPSAQDNCRSNTHVALKILEAEASSEEDGVFELEILQHISAVDDSNAGSGHVLHLLDHFRHEGPNGDHLCLTSKVMDAHMGRYARRFPRHQIPIPALRQISRELLLALSFIHKSCRVIHTGTLTYRSGSAKMVPTDDFRHQATKHHVGDLSAQ